MTATLIQSDKSNVSMATLARLMARGDQRAVADYVVACVEDRLPTCPLEGARRLLVEAAVAIAMDGTTLPFPTRVLSEMDFDVLVAHGYGPDADLTDDARQRVVAYLRRIHLTSFEQLAADDHVADQHELILLPVSLAFGR